MHATEDGPRRFGEEVMTEHLILQAREMQKRMIATTLPGELADALEAQARRIAGYQKDADDYLIRLDELNALRARIAELEAALKPFADKANVFHDYVDDYPIMFGAEPPLRVVHLRAARAALKGERG